MNHFLGAIFFPLFALHLIPNSPGFLCLCFLIGNTAFDTMAVYVLNFFF